MNINMKEIYNTGPTGAYYYWKGINLYFVLASFIGTAISLAIYNPVTCVPHIESIFRVCGAAFPASLVAGACYFVLAKLFLIPRKIGFPPIPQATGANVKN